MPENKEIPSGGGGKNLTAGQKFVVGVVFVFGFGVLALGFAQISQNIKQPFARQTNGNVSQTVVAPQSELEIAIEQKKKDTDADGLSDYDELYLYNTSPYIEDSDSDGLTDKAEITAGKDPNCPEGKDCGAVLQKADAEVKPVISPSEFAGGVGTEAAAPVLDTSLNNPLATTSAGIDAAQLRQMLLASGMDQTVLDKLDDKALLEAYQSALSESASQ